MKIKIINPQRRRRNTNSIINHKPKTKTVMTKRRKTKKRNPGNPGNPRRHVTHVTHRRRHRNPNIDRGMLSNILVQAGGATAGAITAYFAPKMIKKVLPNMDLDSNMLLKYGVARGIPVFIVTWLLWNWNREIAKSFISGAVGLISVEVLNELTGKTGSVSGVKSRGNKLTLKGDEDIFGNGEYDLDNMSLRELQGMLGNMELVTGQDVPDLMGKLELVEGAQTDGFYGSDPGFYGASGSASNTNSSRGGSGTSNSRGSRSNKGGYDSNRVTHATTGIGMNPFAFNYGGHNREFERYP